MVNDTSSTWGKEVIEKTMEYANYEWIAQEKMRSTEWTRMMHALSVALRKK